MVYISLISITQRYVDKSYMLKYKLVSVIKIPVTKNGKEGLNCGHLNSSQL